MVVLRGVVFIQRSEVSSKTTAMSTFLSLNRDVGVVVWEDSALVRAAREGRVLVVDEADKAPVEVVSILKVCWVYIAHICMYFSCNVIKSGCMLVFPVYLFQVCSRCVGWSTRNQFSDFSLLESK